MKLDRAGIDYLIEVAKDMGFEVAGIESCEWEDAAPCVTLSLRQTRAVVGQKQPADVRQGVTEEQAADIATKGKGSLFPDAKKFQTLD